jgi:(R,R)-butanediol dehydrogenase/meso-butanediol dehydrogenase/diacetyl reductase
MPNREEVPMRAVAITEERDLKVVELAEPPLGSGQVRIRVRFCGICGSDLHMKRSPTVPPGVVMGHEFMGVIEELGTEVSGYGIGDRVVANPMDPCGECEQCRGGVAECCPIGIARGIGLGATYGAYAETVVARGSSLFRLPDTVSDEQGALVEPLAVAMHAVRMAAPSRDARCVVLGAGPIGVFTALALRSRGCERVLVIEPTPWRREASGELGFLVTASAEDDSARRRLGGIAGPIFDCSGHSAALASAMNIVAPGGQVIVVGVTASPSSIHSSVLVGKALHLSGSLGYTGLDFTAAIKCLESGLIPERALITSIGPLDSAAHWFEDLSSGITQQLKVLVQP